MPLWFDGVDFGKINVSIAYYGRTYKLSDRSCESSSVIAEFSSLGYLQVYTTTKYYEHIRKGSVHFFV